MRELILGALAGGVLFILPSYIWWLVHHADANDASIEELEAAAEILGNLEQATDVARRSRDAIAALHGCSCTPKSLCAHSQFYAMVSQLRELGAQRRALGQSIVDQSPSDGPQSPDPSPRGESLLQSPKHTHNQPRCRGVSPWGMGRCVKVASHIGQRGRKQHTVLAPTGADPDYAIRMGERCQACLDEYEAIAEAEGLTTGGEPPSTQHS